MKNREKYRLILSIGFILFTIFTIPLFTEAQTVYETTSSLTLPGNSTPYSMNFNTGTIPSSATVTLEIRVLSAVSPDNRDYIMCGGSSYPFTTGNFTSLPKTLSANISTCVRNYDLTSGNRICTTNAWNYGSCAGLFYGTAGNNSVLEYARLTVTLAGSPTVTTQSVSSIGNTTATGNGNVTGLGSSNPTQHGHVWSTSQNPTTSDNKTELGTKSSTGAFTSSLTGLSSNTTYYVRTYATNLITTVYGDQVSFTTTNSYSLSYSAGGNGSLSGTASQSVNSGADGSAITAVPDSGYYFVKWSDDVTSNPRTDTNVNGNVSVSAVFSEILDISNISTASIGNTSGTISWNTNVGATSQVIYGLSSSYGFETLEVSGPNTSHSVTLTDLVPCARQYFKVVSEDEYGTSTSESGGYFSTTGCAQSSLSGSGAEESINRLSGGEIELTNNTSVATLVVPDNYHTRSATFQINKLDTGSVTVPSGKGIVDENAFSLIALDEDGEQLEEFDETITFEVEYGDGTASMYDENTLDVYRYNTGTSSWDAKNCTLDTNTRTLTCSLSSFSMYGVFGDLQGGTTGNSSSNSSAQSSVRSRVRNLIAMGNTDLAQKMMSDNPHLFISTLSNIASPVVPLINNATITSPNGTVSQDLYIASEGEMVKKLQEFLIRVNTGPSAEELRRVGATGYFGQYTRNALIEYQKSVSIKPTSGYFGEITRRHFQSIGENF